MDKNMALLKEWQKIAYDEKKDKGTLQRFWANYFNLEKGVYVVRQTDKEGNVTVEKMMNR